MDRTISFVILSYNHGCPPCYCHLHRQRDRDYHTKIHLRQRLRTDICKMLLAALKLYKKMLELVLVSRFQLKAIFLKGIFGFGLTIDFANDTCVNFRFHRFYTSLETGFLQENYSWINFTYQ